MRESTTRQRYWQDKLHTIIFEADTFAGKLFDVILLVLIVASVLTVMLESIEDYRQHFQVYFYYLEWGFTLIFTLEYVLRLWSVRSPWRYATSFYGVVDLLAILPTFISLIITGTQYLLVIRALRLLRIFRIFKLGHFLREGYTIITALKASRAKITVFISFILIITCIIGSVMYVIEGSTNEAFSSIPQGMYWAIVTLTTVGYGDITPRTDFGQLLSAIVMILGYAVIAVPTGIVSVELMRESSRTVTTTTCPSCSKEGHDQDALWCKYCGHQL